MKIMLFKLGAYGDVLMSTPLVRAIRKKYPYCKLDYYCGKSYVDILKENKYITNVIPFDQMIFFKKQFFKSIKLLNKIKKVKYNLGFVLDKHWTISLFLSMCNIKTRVGFSRGREGFTNTLNVKYGELKHEIDYYLDLGKLVNIEPCGYNMDMISCKTKFNQPTICIAPGGGNNPGVGDDAIRRWPVDKFIKLIDILSKKYIIILVGGETDVDIGREIISRIRNENNVSNLISMHPITYSAYLMAQSNYVICNDSGTMHMASAVNKNIISLFGPSHPKRKAPLHKDSVAIWKDEDIYDSRYEVYGFKPKRNDYMKRIEVEDVLRAIKWK